METTSSSKHKLTPVSKLPRTDGTTVYMDTEGTGLSRFRDKPFALALAVDHRKPHVVRWTPQLAEWLSLRLPHMKQAVFHHTKFDLHQFIQGGVPEWVIQEIPVYCTMVAAHRIVDYDFG